MGFTYDELTVLGRLRKEAKLGPYGMFQRLVHDWSADYTPTQVAKKCKDFFHYYVRPTPAFILFSQYILGGLRGRGSSLREPSEMYADCMLREPILTLDSSTGHKQT